MDAAGFTRRLLDKVGRGSLSRIVAGVGANAYGQVINVVIQLASLPIYLSFWNLEKYGVWLSIFAIPSYLSMADAGMITAASNKITIRYSGGDSAGALNVFQSAQLFVLISSCLVLLVSASLIAVSSINLMTLETCLALFLLVMVVLVTMASGLSTGIFKATGRYAKGAALEVTSRLTEWIGGIIGLVLLKNFVGVALGMLIARLGFTLFIARSATKGVVDLHWGIKYANWREVREMIRPSIGFMAFPISNALSFQGFTLLAANVLGPVAVAIFNTYRTVARIAVQLTSVLSHSLWPEFSTLYGKKDISGFRKLLSISCISGVVIGVLVSAAIYPIAFYFLPYWTKGKIEFMPYLMVLFLLYAAIGSAWHVPRIALMSINKHVRLGAYLLCVSFAAVVFGYFFSSKYEIAGLVYTLIGAEVLGLAACGFLLWLFIKGELRA